MIHFLLTNVVRRDNVIRALCKASGGKIKSEWDGETAPCIVGNGNGMDEVQRQCNKNLIPYIYIDHAYFHRHPQMEWFRICVSNYHCTDWRDGERDAKPKLKGWRTDGRNVIIIKPAPKINSIYPVKQWLDESVSILKQCTDRKIIIKEKGEGDLASVLTDAFAMVCYGSVADVDAVRSGIPAFAVDKSPAYPIATHDLRQIETPSYPDRGQWLRSLSNAEWHLGEANLAWERVKCLLPHTATYNLP